VQARGQNGLRIAGNYQTTIGNGKSINKDSVCFMGRTANFSGMSCLLRDIAVVIALLLQKQAITLAYAFTKQFLFCCYSRINADGRNVVLSETGFLAAKRPDRHFLHGVSRLQVDVLTTGSHAWVAH